LTKIKGNILIIDDDKDVLLTARMILKNTFTRVDTLEKPDKLEDLLIAENYQVIILDMNFIPGATNGKEGLHWLEKIIQIFDCLD